MNRPHQPARSGTKLLTRNVVSFGSRYYDGYAAMVGRNYTHPVKRNEARKYATCEFYRKKRQKLVQHVHHRIVATVPGNGRWSGIQELGLSRTCRFALGAVQLALALPDVP